MFSFISRLQRKPRYKKKMIAFTVSAGFTFFVFIFWASGLYLHGFSSSEETVSRDDRHSPFKVINRNVSQFFAGVSEMLSDTDEILQSSGLYELYETSEAMSTVDSDESLDEIGGAELAPDDEASVVGKTEHGPMKTGGVGEVAPISKTDEENKPLTEKGDHENKKEDEHEEGLGDNVKDSDEQKEGLRILELFRNKEF